MDRLRGLLIIGVLILIGFLINHFIFSFGSSHSTKTSSMPKPTVTTPSCTLQIVKVSNASVRNFYYGVVTIEPLTPFVKVLLLREPSAISVTLKGANASYIKVFIAIESDSRISIVSPQLYNIGNGSTTYYSVLPPGIATVVILNAYHKPITLGIEINVKSVSG